MQSVSIIGVGRVGGALAISLSNKGYVVEKLFSRNAEPPLELIEQVVPAPEVVTSGALEKIDSEVIFVTTQDGNIAEVADQIAEKAEPRGRVVFHTSGTLSSEILRPLAAKGFDTGSIHPLVSISDPSIGSERLADAFFCIEGTARAKGVGEQIVAALGGTPFSIDTRHKALYHASAVTACGHLVALVDIATEMLSKCGQTPESAKEILMPLIRSTVDNLGEQSNAKALTGTFARADIETLEKHIDVIGRELGPEFLDIYLKLGGRSLELARQQGADADKIEQMMKRMAKEEI